MITDRPKYYLTPETLPPRQNFWNWLQKLPDGHQFGVRDFNLCETCPLAQFTGMRATYGSLTGTWAFQFMHAYDSARGGTKEDAVRAYLAVLVWPAEQSS